MKPWPPRYDQCYGNRHDRNRVTPNRRRLAPENRIELSILQTRRHSMSLRILRKTNGTILGCRLDALQQTYSAQFEFQVPNRFSALRISDACVLYHRPFASSWVAERRLVSPYPAE